MQCWRRSHQRHPTGISVRLLSQQAQSLHYSDSDYRRYLWLYILPPSLFPTSCGRFCGRLRSESYHCDHWYFHHDCRVWICFSWCSLHRLCISSSFFSMMIRPSLLLTPKEKLSRLSNLADSWLFVLDLWYSAIFTSSSLSFPSMFLPSSVSHSSSRSDA